MDPNMNTTEDTETPAVEGAAEETAAPAEETEEGAEMPEEKKEGDAADM